MENVISYVTKRNEITFKDFQRILFHLGTLKYVGDVSLTPPQIQALMSKELSRARLNDEVIVIFLIFSKTLSLTCSAFSIKTLMILLRKATFKLC